MEQAVVLRVHQVTILMQVHQVAPNVLLEHIQVPEQAVAQVALLENIQVLVHLLVILVQLDIGHL